ncbi:MAG TPA: hypothetical protein VMW21_02280 [Patescibacteria group bacterium]|nr:hypothetical protein [Patescibacteria group bacterium]
MTYARKANQKPDSQQKRSPLDDLTQEELIDLAAEQLADIFVKQLIYEKSLKNKKTMQPEELI